MLSKRKGPASKEGTMRTDILFSNSTVLFSKWDSVSERRWLILSYGHVNGGEGKIVADLPIPLSTSGEVNDELLKARVYGLIFLPIRPGRRGLLA